MAFDRAGAKAAGYSDAEIDAYLAEKEKAARPALSSMDRPEESFLRSAGRAIESGALLGWADEAVGGIGAGIELARTGSISDALRAYRDITDHEREAAANFSASNPKSDLALQLGGGILSLAATPARALAGAGKTYGQLAAGVPASARSLGLAALKSPHSARRSRIRPSALAPALRSASPFPSRSSRGPMPSPVPAAGSATRRNRLAAVWARWLAVSLSPAYCVRVPAHRQSSSRLKPISALSSRECRRSPALSGGW